MVAALLLAALTSTAQAAATIHWGFGYRAALVTVAGNDSDADRLASILKAATVPGEKFDTVTQELREEDGLLALRIQCRLYHQDSSRDQCELGYQAAPHISFLPYVHAEYKVLDQTVAPQLLDKFYSGGMDDDGNFYVTADKRLKFFYSDTGIFRIVFESRVGLSPALK